MSILLVTFGHFWSRIVTLFVTFWTVTKRDNKQQWKKSEWYFVPVCGHFLVTLCHFLWLSTHLSLSKFCHFFSTFFNCLVIPLDCILSTLKHFLQALWPQSGNFSYFLTLCSHFFVTFYVISCHSVSLSVRFCSGYNFLQVNNPFGGVLSMFCAHQCLKTLCHDEQQVSVTICIKITQMGVCEVTTIKMLSLFKTKLKSHPSLKSQK
jgi:hypothetical protein